MPVSEYFSHPDEVGTPGVRLIKAQLYQYSKYILPARPSKTKHNLLESQALFCKSTN